MKTISPYNITQTTFMSGGKDLTGSVTHKGVCWSVLPTPTWIDDNKSFASANTVDYVLLLTGLTANTKYYVRAFVLIGGVPQYGTEFSFITKTSDEFIEEGCSTYEITLNKNEQYSIPPGYKLVGINGDITKLKGCIDELD